MKAIYLFTYDINEHKEETILHTKFTSSIENLLGHDEIVDIKPALDSVWFIEYTDNVQRHSEMTKNLFELISEEFSSIVEELNESKPGRYEMKQLHACLVEILSFQQIKHLHLKRDTTSWLRQRLTNMEKVCVSLK